MKADFKGELEKSDTTGLKLVENKIASGNKITSVVIVGHHHVEIAARIAHLMPKHDIVFVTPQEATERGFIPSEDILRTHSLKFTIPIIETRINQFAPPPKPTRTQRRKWNRNNYKKKR
jgi:hypothetical protein